MLGVVARRAGYIDLVISWAVTRPRAGGPSGEQVRESKRAHQVERNQRGMKKLAEYQRLWSFGRGNGFSRYLTLFANISL